MSAIKGKPFNADEVYSKTVKYYVDKKGYDLNRANAIAKSIVEREIARRQTKLG